MAISCRRFLRFRLRTLLLALTAVCLWLGWNARQYQTELKVAHRLEALEGLPSIKWSRPGWVKRVKESWQPAIFDRVSVVDFTYAPPIAAAFPSLGLDQLSALDRIVVSETVDEPTIDRLLAKHPRLQVEINKWTLLTHRHKLTRFLQPDTNHNRRVLIALLQEHLQRNRSFGGQAHLRCCSVIETDEIELAKIMQHGHDEARELAALVLWNGQAFRQASDVVVFAQEHQPVSATGENLCRLVADSLRPASIVSALKGPDAAWAARLASITPHPEVLSALVESVMENRATTETVFALTKYPDERATDTLMTLARSSKAMDVKELAAYALAERQSGRATAAMR